MDRLIDSYIVQASAREARDWMDGRQTGRVQTLADGSAGTHDMIKVKRSKRDDEYTRSLFKYAVVKCEWQSGIKYNGL